MIGVVEGLRAIRVEAKLHSGAMFNAARPCLNQWKGGAPRYHAPTCISGPPVAARTGKAKTNPRSAGRRAN